VTGDPTLSLAVIGGLNAILALVGLALFTTPASDPESPAPRFIACRFNRPQCSGVRRISLTGDAS
jgi:hypothetical protein